MRAINGFGESPAATLEAEITRRGRPRTARACPPTRPRSTGAWASTRHVRRRRLRPRPPRHYALGDPAHRNGALAGDADGAKTDGRGRYEGSYDLIRAPLAAGLPTGDRTVEAWVWSDNAGARLIAYGDFSVELDTRAIVVGGTALELPPDDDRQPRRRPLAPRRGHLRRRHRHRLPRRRALRPHRRDAQHRRPPATCSARASPPAASPATTSSPSTRARSTPRRIAAHFAASCNGRPSAPAGVTATPGEQPRDAALDHAGPAARAADQRAVDHYVVEAPGARPGRRAATRTERDPQRPARGPHAGDRPRRQRLRRRPRDDRRRRPSPAPPRRTRRPSPTTPRAVLAPRRAQRHARRRRLGPRPHGAPTSPARPAHPPRGAFPATPTARWPTAAPGTRAATT